MTLDDAVAHIGSPVLVHDFPRLHDGEIVAGPDGRGLVCVRVRRKRAPYDLLPGRQWWHPAKLTVPKWWVDRQGCEGSDCAPAALPLRGAYLR